ncbi:Uncharacterised protein [Vibrio cholerae]|nr:Uncharacterised protein [Vibrio cholerae]
MGARKHSILKCVKALPRTGAAHQDLTHSSSQTKSAVHDARRCRKLPLSVLTEFAQRHR